MTAARRPNLLLACYAICSLSGEVLAHDQWLETEVSRESKKAQVKVYLLVGEQFEKGEPAATRRSQRFSRFEMFSGAGKRDLRAQLREDQQPIAILTNVDNLQMIAMDSTIRDIELSSHKFEEYLLEEGLIDVLAERARTNSEESPGRERYSRCLKRIFPSTQGSDSIVTKTVGQDLEIVPLQDVFKLNIGDEFSLQVLYHGKPTPNRAVVAANRWRANVARQRHRTDAQGRVRFRLERKGDWMIRLVHMETSQEAGVDWRSHWGNLTFTLAE